MDKRILVLGGRGYYGSLVVEVLESRGFRVGVASRHGEFVMDLREPKTFGALEVFELVINCADSINAPPDEAIWHVLSTGGTWVEVSADAALYERLAARELPSPLKGTLIMGAGLFPGLSTLLADALASAQPKPPRSVELVIGFSPLSGAGDGNCALMAHSLFLPASRFEAGQLIVNPRAVGAVDRLQRVNDRARVVQVTLPDVKLVERATSAPYVATWFALSPSWLYINFVLLAWLVWALRLFKRLLIPVLAWQMRFLRGFLLRSRSTFVELTAIVDRGLPTEQARSLRVEDGQQATAQAVVSVVVACERLSQREPLPLGRLRLTELVSLDEILEGIDGVTQRHRRAP